MLLPLFFRRPFGHLSYHTLPSAQILARRCPQFLLLSKLRAAAAGGRFGRGAWPTAILRSSLRAATAVAHMANLIARFSFNEFMTSKAATLGATVVIHVSEFDTDKRPIGLR